jgi:hypothetical protein
MHIASGRLSSGKVGNASMITQPDDFPPFSLITARGIEALDTQAAAEALASRVVHAWAREGHKVTAWVIRSVGTCNSPPAWAVRTDLVNGMPSGLGRYGWEVKYGRIGV